MKSAFYSYLACFVKTCILNMCVSRHRISCCSPSRRPASRPTQQPINQSNSSKSHTSTREAPSQHHHTGSKPRVAKRRRLGGLIASRASVSLRDSLHIYTLSTEARENCRGKPPTQQSCRVYNSGRLEYSQVNRVITRWPVLV